MRGGEGHILKKVHPNAYQKDLDDGEGSRYDHRGNVLEKADTSGRTLICCTYHADGRLRILTDESGKTVAYGYDWKGNLAGIANEKGGQIVSYSHYPDGKLKDIRHFNGVSSRYEYDTDGNISRLTTMTGDHEPLRDFRHEYDLNGIRQLPL